MSRPLKLAVVAGEESGDLLGADLVAALGALSRKEVELAGVGGRNLQGLGLRSLFDADEIALMGITAVLRDLPRLVRRIGQTASAIVRERPDCLVTIDSPDFSLRVARKVRAAAPSIPILHYVCPSVWAWRPGRAAAMRPHVDRILCLLPFEPAELERLGGPPGTYVGHRLARDPDLLAAAEAQLGRKPPQAGGRRSLLLLPGSRRSEVQALTEPFGETVARLRERGHAVDVRIPTVPHVAELVAKATAGWPERPEIILDAARKWQAFSSADAALACSGTVTLELALARIPTVSCYKADLLGRAVIRFITAWSASLPNLVAGWPVVPEHYNELARPAYLEREIAQLWTDSPMRRAQREGFAEVARAMATDRPSGELAAEAVMESIRQSAIGNRQSE